MDLSYQLPKEYLQRMERWLGSEYAQFILGYTQPGINGLRVNTLKIDPPEFLQLSPFHLQAVSWCPAGFRLGSASNGLSSTPGKHALHSAGLYYLQDPSAMAAAEILAPQPGEKVLDLSAAPGGKATHLAALMQNKGLLVANEIHPQRAWILAENLERCGATNAAILQDTPQRLASHFSTFFDRVLVDAPCSGEGMFRKSQEARQAWSIDLVHSCSLRQQSILHSAAELVRPGGFLLYSTCTFAPEENEMVISAFLSAKNSPGADFELVKIIENPAFTPGQPDWIQGDKIDAKYLEKTVRLWPHHEAGEGHFFALLQRKRGEAASPKRPFPIQLSEPMRRLAGDFFQDLLSDSLPTGNLTVKGHYLYLIPEGLPELDHLKVIHPGWWLGELHKNRIEPSHAMALGLRPNQTRRRIEVSINDLRVPAYLHGEALRIEGTPGWNLFTIQTDPAGSIFALGWGKHSQGVLKNAYPRGLRWM